MTFAIPSSNMTLATLCQIANAIAIALSGNAGVSPATWTECTASVDDATDALAWCAL